MGALPAYTRRGQPLEGPSSLPTDSGQAATYDSLGAFVGWVTPQVAGETVVLDGSASGSTTLAVNSTGNLTVTTTGASGTTPGMTFNAVGGWGNQQAVFSFRENGVEFLKIDGFGNVVLSSGNVYAPSTNPSVGQSTFVGNGMRRQDTAVPMQFYHGESTGSGDGVQIAPISGTKTAGRSFAVYADTAKTLPRFAAGADGAIDMPGLPTSDPLVAGRLWNNSGVLNVSAG